MSKTSFWIKNVIYGAALISTLSLTGYAAGVDQPTPASDMRQAVLEAKSKADHESLAAQYEREAQEDEQKAKLHEDMAKAYAKVGYLTEKQNFTRHCDVIAQKYKDAAVENLALAKAHKELAEKMK